MSQGTYMTIQLWSQDPNLSLTYHKQQATFCNHKRPPQVIKYSHLCCRSVTSSPITLPIIALQSHRCPCSPSNMPSMFLPPSLCLAAPQALEGPAQISVFLTFFHSAQISPQQKSLPDYTPTIFITSLLSTQPTTCQSIYLLFNLLPPFH